MTDPATQFNTGAFYPDGVVTSDAQAFVNVQNAAALGVSTAQFLLGLSYFQGSNVTKDLVQAKHWFTLASNQGSIQANYYLAQIP